MKGTVRIPLAQLTKIATAPGTSEDIGDIIYVRLETAMETPAQKYTTFEFMMSIQQAHEICEDIQKAVDQKE